ncbi:MAG: ribonuclease H-like domain-containing protein [Spirochaetales bacterium]|nr:ribonuclease H-like domain-containing protein [Spirochaetales bacterium]
MNDPISSLREKLRFIESGRVRPGEKKQIGQKKPVISLPPEWKKEGEFVYQAVTRKKNPFHFSDLSSFDFIPAGTRPEDLLFFDVETTGLSGGAGNIFFLIGLGRVEGEEFVIRQIFLSDFPGEPEYLGAVARLLPPECLYVSYNGKGFDSHLIRSRYLFHGMTVAIERQLDLLYLSRRFWKRRIGSCSLCDMEEKVLLFSRINDVGGYEIPDIYFDFLSTGETEGINRIFSHNLQDIHSLALLLNRILSVSSGSNAVDPDTIDMGALGEFLLLNDNPEGIAVLRRAFTAGDRRAGKTLSLYLKRKCLWEEAAAIWRVMAEAEKSLFAAIELAKLYEHRKRDYDEALFWVDFAFALNPPFGLETRGGLIKRKKRIEEKKRKRQ